MDPPVSPQLGIAAADLVSRQLGSEQDLAASVGSDHAVAGQPGPEPVDRPLKAALQHARPECVEVVLAGEQQQRGDALERATQPDEIVTPLLES
jgi:hypothetical protein